jgi:hypothetical protein
MGIRGFVAAAITALIVSGCGGITSPSDNVITPHSGTIEVLGSDNPIQFSASKNGEFFVTLTALSPDSTATIGMNFGQQTSGGCAFISQAPAIVGRQALGGRIDKGNYCVQVFDPGLVTLSGPQTYTIRISTP